MAEQSLLTPEIEALVNVPGEPQSLTLSVDMVARVCDTLGLERENHRELAPHGVLLAVEMNLDRRTIYLPMRSLITGEDWEWRRPLSTGERLTGVHSLVEARERFGGRLGHSLFMTYQWLFRDEAGAEAAAVRRSMAYFDPASRPDRGEEQPRPSQEEIEPHAPPRVSGLSVAVVGDHLPSASIVPGTERVLRYAGTAWAFESFFWDADSARAAGLPGPIVPGPLKVGLLSQWLQGLAGDGGFLESLRAAHRRPDTHDVELTFGGVVTDIADAGDQRRLTCEVWIERSGERSLAGMASVLVSPP